MGAKINACRSSILGSLKEIGLLEDLDMNGQITLKRVLKK
jgi:hypothetical protein